MEIVIALAFAAVVLVGADRLLLWMESRGHIHWCGKDLSAVPTTELDSMLSEQSRR